MPEQATHCSSERNVMTTTHVLAVSMLTFSLLQATAPQQPGQAAKPRPQDTEVWEPVPKVVAPGTTPSLPPADAIILFDGKNLDQWVSANKEKSPAGWTVADGVMTVNKKTGNIETKRTFTNYQLHLEYR